MEQDNFESTEKQEVNVESDQVIANQVDNSVEADPNLSKSEGTEERKEETESKIGEHAERDVMNAPQEDMKEILEVESSEAQTKKESNLVEGIEPNKDFSNQSEEKEAFESPDLNIEKKSEIEESKEAHPTKDNIDNIHETQEKVEDKEKVEEVSPKFTVDASSTIGGQFAAEILRDSFKKKQSDSEVNDQNEVLPKNEDEAEVAANEADPEEVKKQSLEISESLEKPNVTEEVLKTENSPTEQQVNKPLVEDNEEEATAPIEAEETKEKLTKG